MNPARTAVCVLLLAAAPTLVSAQTPKSKPAGVSYASVLALEHRPPERSRAYGQDAHQFAEFWPAAGVETPKARLVMVHGGCWLNAFDLGHTRPLATALADHGYDVWSLEYRRTGDPGGGWPGSLEDVVRAIQQVLSEGDKRPVILLGHSAGGHLALLAAQQTSVDGVIGLAAITDIARYAAGDNSCQKAAPRFMGGSPSERARDYQAATPGNPGVPVHLLYGGADRIVPKAQAELSGMPHSLEPDAGHFDWIHPDTAAFALVRMRLEEMTSP